MAIENLYDFSEIDELTGDELDEMEAFSPKRRKKTVNPHQSAAERRRLDRKYKRLERGPKDRNVTLPICRWRDRWESTSKKAIDDPKGVVFQTYGEKTHAYPMKMFKRFKHECRVGYETPAYRAKRENERLKTAMSDYGFEEFEEVEDESYEETMRKISDLTDQIAENEEKIEEMLRKNAHLRRMRDILVNAI